MAKRRTFTAAFKARVAKEALRADKTVRMSGRRRSASSTRRSGSW